MSDFYDPRRTIIADVSGLVGMALGGFAASMFVWDALATGFRTGRLERAFFVFLGVVIGASMVGGLVGLAAGRAIGGAWERRHRRGRQTAPAASHLVPGPPDGSASAAGAVARHEPVATATPRDGTTAPPGVALRPFGAEVDQFLVLLRRATPHASLAGRSAESLRRSHNVGAWDGERLVGAVRVVSDGHAALVTELLVDPDYRRRGIGRALLRAAVDHVAGGALSVIAPDHAAAAFLRAAGATPDAGAFRVGGIGA
jgi:GNAT superfamily N-acetyltransferase